MTNLRDPESKFMIQKATDFVASSDTLITGMMLRQCTILRARVVLEGAHTGHRTTHIARTWTWEMAGIITAGVSEIVDQVHEAP